MPLSHTPLLWAPNKNCFFEDKILRLDHDDPLAEDPCPICQEAFTTKEFPVQIRNIANCTHVFGRHCLEKWLKDNNTCPMCRTELYTKPALYSMWPSALTPAELTHRRQIRDMQIQQLISEGISIRQRLRAELECRRQEAARIETPQPDLTPSRQSLRREEWVPLDGGFNLGQEVMRHALRLSERAWGFLHPEGGREEEGERLARTEDGGGLDDEALESAGTFWSRAAGVLRQAREAYTSPC